MINCKDHRAYSGALACAFVFLVVWFSSIQPYRTPPPGSLDAALTALRGRDYEEGQGLFGAALAAGGDPALCLAGRAECLFYLRRYDEALECCDALRRACPNAARQHTLRGLVYRRTDRENESREQFRAAVRQGDKVALTLLPKGN